MTVLEPGSTFAGKYLIDGVLGKGGMGAVYSATNQAIGRRVAIKVLVADLADRDDIKARFELEARAAAVINHPGIVDVLDMGQTAEGEPFIVMEHLDGATLKAVFKRRGVFSPAEAVAVAQPLLDALAAAHQASVIHRDIKPANIFLCTRPQRLVKLLDFGISRFGQSTGLTHSGTAVGTPKYMAPEQLLGEKTLGPAADLYSVGAVLYELLGGRAPYDADSDIATLAKLLQEEHQPLIEVRADLPKRLCAFIDALLVKDPAQRPSDAGQVKQALTELVAPGDLTPLFDLAHEAASRTATGGTPRPASNVPRTAPTAPARRPSVTRMPAARAATPAPPAPPRRNSATRMPAARPPAADASPAPRPSSGRRSTGRTPKPPPAELSSTSAALEPVAERSGAGGLKKLVLGVAIGVPLLLLGAWGSQRLAPKEPFVAEEPAPAEPTKKPSKAVRKPVANAVPTAVVVTLRAEPADTRFEVDGEKLDGNPLTLKRTKGSDVSVIASAQGFEPKSLKLRFDEAHEERVTLSRPPVVAPPPLKPGQKPPPQGAKKPGKLTVDETNPYE
ncbi:MAG: serine/threonine protein kinase [Myxococcus sp.]|nr:serine/threonine protein kinase [Myxococcus sp.]